MLRTIIEGNLYRICPMNKRHATRKKINGFIQFVSKTPLILAILSLYFVSAGVW